MNKPLIALASAALMMVAAGCSPDSDSSASASASAPAASSPSSASPSSASPSPGGPAAPSASTSSASASSGSPSAPGSSASPSAASTSAAIAEGFPTGLVPVLPGSTPLTTSFEETPALFTASLSATTAASVQEILDYYAKTFTAQGFTAGEPEVQKTATVQQFLRSGADDTANVTVVPREGGNTYTASINTLPESAK